jgi:hypothetical protein
VVSTCPLDGEAYANKDGCLACPILSSWLHIMCVECISRGARVAMSAHPELFQGPIFFRPRTTEIPEDMARRLENICQGVTRYGAERQRVPSERAMKPKAGRLYTGEETIGMARHLVRDAAIDSRSGCASFPGNR